MEANKENIRKLIKPISRIPLPLQPLPPLPTYLVHNKRMNEIENERHPLKTIDFGTQLSLPGTSKNLNKIQKPVLKMDTRHVTVRQKDDLEWARNIFNDVKGDDSVIVISNDEKKQNNYRHAVVTPTLKSHLEPNEVRNIKRSLKRPHSRELQGLSPVTEEQKKDDEHVRRRLGFNESVQNILVYPSDFWKKSYMKSLHPEYTSKIFPYLLGMEQRAAVSKMCSTMRACVVNWLMKVNGADGNPATIQAACWYLDLVLSTGRVQVDKLQIIAAACYWVARKLHGPHLHAHKLVKYSNFAFTTKGLLAAEKAVLEKLKFPRQPIVPQEYITYLSWWCDQEHPAEIEVGATFLTMCYLVVDKRSCAEFASVIAAAAIKNTLVLLKKSHLLERLQLSPLYKAVEQKAESLSQTCFSLSRTVRTIASTPAFEYKAPLEHYGVPPHYIAHIILKAATEPELL